MGFFIKNDIFTLKVTLNLLKILSFLVPRQSSNRNKILLYTYRGFWFNFLVGIYIIVQFGELIVIWGDLDLMVSTSFLLFTNMALALKILNVVFRGEKIQAIIDEVNEEIESEERREGKVIIEKCNSETKIHFYIYVCVSGITVMGLAASAEKGNLPLSAWYPYDETKSPAYEMTYTHQVVAVHIAAFLNICLDTLVTSLIAACRCRLKLEALSLKNLCKGCDVGDQHFFTPDQEKIIVSRFRPIVIRHQATLRAVDQIQSCFSESILVQLLVSTIIICVTAYELASALHSDEHNMVRLIAMLSYLLAMVEQVFLYCYQGNQLTAESDQISYAVYSCDWHRCSVRVRRSLLVVMIRTRRIAKLSAGGFTTLSLACFTSIVKLSYTFFTVLQRVEDRKVAGRP